MLATDQIKKDFPILERTNSSGKRLVYLDNAATTQKPESVIEAISGYYRNSNANIHRGIHFLGTEATQLFEDTRQKVKAFIGGTDEGEVIFVRGTTEAINLVASSFGSYAINEGDRILVSAMEHHSNLVPWQQLAKTKGAFFDVVDLTLTGDLSLDDLRSKLSDRTRIITIPHISNSLGTINPVEKIIELAHERGIPVLVDGAQSVGHQPLNVSAMGCDFFTFSGHKMFGPTGIGVLYAKKEYLERMPPYQFGGEMIRSVSFEATTFAHLPHKFEAGTPDIAGAAGLSAAIDYLEKVGMNNIRDYTEELTHHCVKALREIDQVNIIGDPQRRGSIVSFTMDNAHPHDVATILDHEGIAIRAGHHCTMPLMHSLSLPGTNRVSLAFYNDREDIDKLCAALSEVNKIFGDA